MGTLHVCVVGAGAAGLTAALRAAEGGARITLLNAHPKIGLKILMSGGTRCNVTHEVVTERDFHGGSRPFVRRVLAEFDVPATLAWFRGLGVELKLEPTGKYFPESDDAQSVLDALLGAAASAGVVMESGARVVRVERAGEGGGYRLGVQSVLDSAAFGAAVARVRETRWDLPPAEPDRWLDADRVVLATGGLSFPRTGSDGTGYALATALGHTLVPPTPALTPLAAEDAWCRELQGLTVDAELRLTAVRERVASVRGSLLFAHFGYSGPVALDLSRHWYEVEDGAERRVLASFLPGETEQSLGEWLVRLAASEPRAGVRGLLGRRVPERLAAALCVEAEVAESTPIAQLPREARTRLVARTLSRAMPVTGTLGYEKAEVTAGGVRLSEVDPRTLESRVAPGVYLCGEILDVEGRLGGFNFQWSWSSGTVAGSSAGRVVS